MAKLKKKLDAVFSKFIRQRDAGICFTCGIKKEQKYQQNGHYISRQHNSTRYDEQNCHCQCVRCNIMLNGNMDEYALRLIRKYGAGILKKLNKKKKEKKQFKENELKNLIEHYNKLIK